MNANTAAKPKLTIIMPCFNCTETIERAINSYTKLQDYQDIQAHLYVIDDCSTDSTPDKVRAAAEKSQRIRLITQSGNFGPGMCRNIALEMVRDGYVGFLDADDEIVPDNYYRAFKSGLEAGADWITCNGWQETDGARTEKYDFRRLSDDTAYLLRKCLRSELDGSVIFTIYQRVLIARQRLTFHSGYYEDIPFAHIAMTHANKRCIFDEYCYIKHNTTNSIVNSISEKHILGLVNSTLEVYGQLRDLRHLNANYDEDFSYGVHGYIANLIRDILHSKFTRARKVELLNFLAREVGNHGRLKDIELLGDTPKSRIASHFLRNLGTINQDVVECLNRTVDELR